MTAPGERALLAALAALDARAVTLGPPVSGWSDVTGLIEHYRIAGWAHEQMLTEAIPPLEKAGLIETVHVAIVTRSGVADSVWMRIGPAGLAEIAANGHGLALLRPIGDDEVRWLCECGAEGAVTGHTPPVGSAIAIADHQRHTERPR